MLTTQKLIPSRELISDLDKNRSKAVSCPIVESRTITNSIPNDEDSMNKYESKEQEINLVKSLPSGDKVIVLPQKLSNLHIDFNQTPQEFQLQVSDNQTNLEVKSKSNPSLKLIKLQNLTHQGISFYPQANILNLNNDYVIFSANYFKRKEETAYLFTLPIACLTWINIGYNCFVNIVYDRLDSATAGVIDFLQNQMSQLNGYHQLGLGSVILMHVKVDLPFQIKQMSQIVRIFAPNLLKAVIFESLSAETYQDLLPRINNLYMITSDADLGPVVPINFVRKDSDFLVTTVLKIAEKQDIFYVAMSCIGGFLDKWNLILPEPHKFYNSTSIMQQVELDKIYFKQREKVDWYADQYLVSKYLKDYAKKYGWERIYIKNKKNKFSQKFNSSLEHFKDVVGNFFILVHSLRATKLGVYQSLTSLCPAPHFQNTESTA